MRVLSRVAAMAAALFMLTPSAQAVTDLGAFTGWRVYAVEGDSDTTPYPDLLQGLSSYERFKVIKLKVTQPMDLRLDLAWLEVTDTVSSGAGMNLAELNYLRNFALRAADGSTVPATAGPTYFNATNRVKSFYGTINVPLTSPDPLTGQMYATYYRTTQRSFAQLYKSLPVGEYTITVLVSAQGPLARTPHAEMGVYTGPATDFATYQDAIAAPINLGPSTVVPGDLTASGITTTTTPNVPPVPPCPVSYAVTETSGSLFKAAVKVGNLGTSAQTGWTVQGTYDKNTILFNPKNAKLSQRSGFKAFTATPVAASNTIPAGGSTTFTFSGTKGSTVPALTGLSLTAGGSTCAATLAP